jgi:threonine/homoserine efflux transporter RhtA
MWRVNSVGGATTLSYVTAALRSRIPAPVWFVAGGISMYAGAALAVGLFDRIAPAGVAVLRMAGAAAVLLAWRRPRPGAAGACCGPRRSGWRPPA